MKRLVVYAVVVAATLNLGCETRLFKYTVTIEQTTQYNLEDPDGSFVSSSFISRTSVARSFNLPDGARVTSLDIESLSLRAQINNTNVANDVTVTGQIGRTPTSSEPLFDRKTIPLGGPGGGLAGEVEVALNVLLQGGVTKLKTELENFVKGLGTGQLVEIAVSGFTSPAQSRLSVTLILDIKGTVKYQRCEEVFKGWSAGEECGTGSDFGFGTSANP